MVNQESGGIAPPLFAIPPNRPAPAHGVKHAVGLGLLTAFRLALSRPGNALKCRLFRRISDCDTALATSAWGRSNKWSPNGRSVENLVEDLVEKPPSASDPVPPQCTKPAAEERVAGERIPILDRAFGPSSGMGFVGSGERIECSYGFEQAP